MTVGACANQRGIAAAVVVEHGDFRRLQSLGADQLEFITGAEL